MLLEAIVWCAILGRTVSMDFDSPNRLCLSSGHPTEGTNDSVGSYSANGTLLSFSLPGDDEFFSYSVEGDTLKIGDDFFYMEFIRK